MEVAEDRGRYHSEANGLFLENGDWQWENLGHPVTCLDWLICTKHQSHRDTKILQQAGEKKALTPPTL